MLLNAFEAFRSLTSSRSLLELVYNGHQLLFICEDLKLHQDILISLFPETSLVCNYPRFRHLHPEACKAYIGTWQGLKLGM